MRFIAHYFSCNRYTDGTPRHYFCYNPAMAIYFLRHGESEANAKGLYDGQGLNAKLTKLG